MTANDGLIEGPDGARRCAWHGNLPDYLAYHDEEWGRPVADDRRLFEKIVLEGFQSGLSWLTILRKRAGFRAAFADFDFERMARFGEADVERLLADAGIVRHRRKIESAINNAKRACDLIDQEGSLAGFLWRYEPPASERPARADWETLRKLTDCPQSRALAKELKRRGWSFVGPTTLYAFMQAVGLVNDHVEGCSLRETVDAERAAFKRPT
ncbi:DNA-3-methyladenine glycosylase I [Amorphus sp. 3PC139-8]|uniref:DNA-3-methyladenine glycosylase I n=1 Tax=Amorphus sp. 3PC139-8 TaxID=2735676 RepID=UPI00345D8A60